MTAASLSAGSSGDGVESLQAHIAALVLERQALHAELADRERLERNRLELALLQQRLSRALVDRHAPAPQPAF